MNVLIVYQQGCQKEIVSSVKDLFKYSDIDVIERDDIKISHYAGKNLVIVIGGDGTFLRASHLNKNVPMFGINPRPEQKEGFYMQSDISDYKEKLKMVFAGDYKITKLFRLIVSINDAALKELVCNEVYIGDNKPYTVFNYSLKIGEKEEFQRSSGIIIGTPSGSNAWIKSAGGTVLEKEEQKIEYIVREPYVGRLTPDYSLTKGVLGKGEKIRIVPKSPGIIVIDSISKEHKINSGDEVKISASSYPLLCLRV